MINEWVSVNSRREFLVDVSLSYIVFACQREKMSLWKCLFSYNLEEHNILINDTGSFSNIYSGHNKFRKKSLMQSQYEIKGSDALPNYKAVFFFGDYKSYWKQKSKLQKRKLFSCGCTNILKNKEMEKAIFLYLENWVFHHKSWLLHG